MTVLEPVSAAAPAIRGGPVRVRSLAAAALVVSSLLGHASGPRANDPVVAIPLAPLGFEAISPRYLAGGSAMFTLHFVDDTHLLFTFNSRGLMPRLPDATADDDDRNVTALLLELPTGRILARTVWRTRDHDTYLWPLGHGRFVRRVRDRLTVISPLAGLAAGNAFAEQSFLDMKRRIAYLAVSPGGDLLTIETAPPRVSDSAAALAAAQAAAMQAAQTQQGLQSRNGSSSASAQIAPAKIEFISDSPDLPPIQLHFFRLAYTQQPGEPERLQARMSGLLAAKTLLAIPATAEGFIDAVPESSRTYDFDFVSHTGQRKELAPYDTSCAPRPAFISRSEFVAFGCRGANERNQLSGFNLRGEEPWISNLSGKDIGTQILTSPEAGRFALSRVLVGATFVDLENILPDELTGQEITVQQMHDGRTLLRVLATPVERTQQNFDLSPNGLSLAVVRNDKIEIYRLPALTPLDEKRIKIAVSDTPQSNEARIQLHSDPPGAPPPAPVITAKKPAAAIPSSAAQPVAAATTANPPAPPADSNAPPPLIPSDPVDIVDALSFGPPARKPSSPQTAPSSAPTAVAPEAAHEPEQPRKPPTLFDDQHPKPPGA